MASPLLQAKAELFRTLGHPLRLHVLDLLQSGPKLVSDLIAAAGVEAPTMSQQLAVLRRAGLVAAHRQGARVTYTLSAPELADLLSDAGRTLGSVLADRDELRNELHPRPASVVDPRPASVVDSWPAPVVDSWPASAVDSSLASAGDFSPGDPAASAAIFEVREPVDLDAFAAPMAFAESADFDAPAASTLSPSFTNFDERIAYAASAGPAGVDASRDSGASATPSPGPSVAPVPEPSATPSPVPSVATGAEPSVATGTEPSAAPGPVPEAADDRPSWMARDPLGRRRRRTPSISE